MQREVPGDPGAGTSSYWVMPSNAATKISTIFRDRVITELIYILISAAMVSMMFRRLIFGYISFITFWQFVCITSFYLSLNAILTSHFSNITYFRQQQQQNKPMKYYEILPTHTETPRNTTRKIANLYIEFNCHFLTLQKKSHYFWTGVFIKVLYFRIDRAPFVMLFFLHIWQMESEEYYHGSTLNGNNQHLILNLTLNMLV